MTYSAEPLPRTPILAVEHAARVLRMGGFVVLSDQPGRALLAAENAAAIGADPFRGPLPRDLQLVLTGQRLAALGVPCAAEADYGVHLNGAARPALVAALIDPTSPVSEAAKVVAATAKAPVWDVGPAIELCKLAGLLPAVLVTAVENIPHGAERALIETGSVVAYRRLQASSLRPVSEARVPLADAEQVRVVSFRPIDGGPEQYAILVGEPERQAAPLARLHSECFTGDLLGSLRCDCGDQLRGAIRRMAEEGAGVLLYLAQEGRGIGLVNKLRAYMIQDRGLDTVDANHHLGFDNDERDFWSAATILRQLGIGRVRLLTNNPTKIDQLRRYGIEVTGRVPHIFESNAHNHDYLLTKAHKSGHMLTADDLTAGSDAPRRLKMV
ncbi:MAG: GTP cyclohydrolase II [Geminicoccaceae bacterium]